MKTKVLFLLVVTTLNATGATIDTTRIDQLTGLKDKLNRKGRRLQNQFHPRRYRVFG